MWMRVSSTHGRRWCGAGIMWMWVYTLPTAASDVGLASCEWECPLHTACCWGAGIVWIREQCLPDTAATDEGLVSCEWVRSQVIGLCTWQNAALRRGAACLDSGFFRAASAETWVLSSRICPRLSAPPWKGDVRSQADVLSCRFDGWEKCGHSLHKLITRVLKVHHWSRADGLILKKKSYSPERCRGAAIQARPRMSEPQLWAVIV